MMKAKSSIPEKSSTWITLTGVVLAFLFCLLATSMVRIIYPESSSFFEGLLGSGKKLTALDPASVFSAAQPTPFQPGPAYTPMPAPQPDNPTSGSEESMQVAYAPAGEQSAPSNKPDAENINNDEEEIPMSAYVGSLRGSAQLYTLDCESQSAVDWARFFGVKIDEEEFIDRLPRSDDPESGFVGNINGVMGQFPPNDYGVHAAPIAKLLKEYGLPAKAKRNWDFESLKKEIANDQPVIAWIVNMPFEIDTMEYTASNGNTTTVARFEHTWIITGYNASTVTVVASEWTYNVKIAEFLERWEALGNQAVIYTGD